MSQLTDSFTSQNRTQKMSSDEDEFRRRVQACLGAAIFKMGSLNSSAVTASHSDRGQPQFGLSGIVGKQTSGEEAA